MGIKKLIRKLVLGYRSSSEDYLKYLRKIGVTLGEDIKIFAPASTTIDVQQPHLLRIGNNVNITGPVTILTHDYSTIACKEFRGGVLSV